MMTVKHTPYAELSLEALLAEIDENEEWLKQASEQVAWAEENDEDSGIIDAYRSDAEHAVADWNWMRQEMFNRGYNYDSREGIWKHSS